MTNGTDTEACASREHCTSCPYVLGWKDELAAAMDCHQMTEQQMLSDIWEGEPTKECPHGMTLLEAIAVRGRKMIDGWRDIQMPALKRWTKELLRHATVDQVLQMLTSAAADRVLRIHWLVELMRDAAAAGVCGSGSYSRVADESAGAVLAAQGNDAGYWELARCVWAEMLTGAEAKAIASKHGIVEPAYVRAR